MIFADQVGFRLVLALLLLKPLAIILCMRSGVPGGLFTPSLTFGGLLGAALGYAWNALWPGLPLGFFALLGAGAVLSATTQGLISAVVLRMELTGRDRSFILPGRAEVAIVPAHQFQRMLPYAAIQMVVRRAIASLVDQRAAATIPVSDQQPVHLSLTDRQYRRR